MKTINEYISKFKNDIINERFFGGYYDRNQSKKFYNLWSDLALLGSFLLGGTIGIITGTLLSTTRSVKSRYDSNGRYIPYSQRNYKMIENNDSKILKNIKFSKIEKNKEGFEEYLEISKTSISEKRGFYKIQSFSNELDNFIKESESETDNKGYFVGTINKDKDFSLLCLGIMLMAFVKFNDEQYPILIIDLENETPNKKIVFEKLFSIIVKQLKISNGIVFSVLNGSKEIDDLIKGKNYQDISNNVNFIVSKDDENINQEFDKKIKKILEKNKLFIYKPIIDKDNKNNI